MQRFQFISSVPVVLIYQGCSSRGLVGCIMRPAVTFVNYVLLKLLSNLRGLVYHLF